MANQQFLENLKNCKEGEEPEIPKIQYASTGNAKDLKILLNNCPEIQQMLGDMRADANIKYAVSGMSAEYKHPKSNEEMSELSERNQKIAAFIDAHPKAVLALSILNEERKAIGLPIEKLDTAEALQKRCEKADVKNITEKIRYADRTESIKNATKTAASYAMIEKTSRGTSVHTA
jgi:hypothetical protein